MELIAFGLLTDIIGKESLNSDGIGDTDQLKEVLRRHYPSISAIPYSIAVNNRIISGNQALGREDVVSLLPPFSGG